ncbi:MAG: hypothetical protein EOO90_07415 [Pedobacter sp.]|nr:MAG: hypothetical protein EOO90_07415 [Pedobacter sp.]
MDRLCLECEDLLRGRADKKFCDDHCRSNYNYKQKSQEHAAFNKINQILRRNRNILKRNNPFGKTKVKRDNLLMAGFDFRFHTHTRQTQQGDIYCFCYDFGYLRLHNGEVLLVKQDGK